MGSNETGKTWADNFSRSDKQTELFHYTNLNALEGILETNTLWASRADCLNDSSELTLLWPMLEEQCGANFEQFVVEFLEQHPSLVEKAEEFGGVTMMAKQDGKTLVRTMRSLMFGDGGNAGMGMPFVASFSAHNDKFHRENGMLSQWRGYGGTGENVALVLDEEELCNLVELEGRQFHYMSCSITDVVYFYDGLDLTKRFPGLFGALKTVTKCLISNYSTGMSDDEESRDGARDLARELLPAAAKLKHRAFDEERERRIIVGAPDENIGDQRPRLKNRIKLKKIHYRSGTCGSIPYVKLFEDINERLPISRILVGPSRNQNTNVEAVHNLLARCAAHQTISVDRSTIPYVGST